MNRANLSVVLGVLLLLGGFSASAATNAELAERQKEIREKIDNLRGEINDLHAEAAKIGNKEQSREWSDALESAGEALQDQWQNIKSVSASAWEGAEDTAENAIEKTRQTYENVRRSFEQWRSRQRLEDIKQKKDDLAERAGGFGEEISNRFSSNQMALNSNIHEAEEKLHALDNAAGDQWLEAKAEVEDAFKEAERSLNYLERKIYRWNAKEKIDDYGEKIVKLKSLPVKADDKAKKEFQDALSSLESSWQNARQRVEEWAGAEDDQWKSFKNEIDEALENVRRSYNEAKEYVTS